MTTKTKIQNSYPSDEKMINKRAGRKLINKLPAQPFFGYYRLLLSLFGRFGYIYTAHDDDVVADAFDIIPWNIYFVFGF